MSGRSDYNFSREMLNPIRILRLVCHSERSVALHKDTTDIVLSRGSADVVSNADNVDTSIAYKTKLQRANSTLSRFTTSFTTTDWLMEIRLFTATISSNLPENFRRSDRQRRRAVIFLT